MCHVSRGVSRQAGIPPTLCTAKTRAGEPCKNYCSVGRVTCYLHGGAAGQVVRKAEERLTFAQLLQSDPRPLPLTYAVDNTSVLTLTDHGDGTALIVTTGPVGSALVTATGDGVIGSLAVDVVAGDVASIKITATPEAQGTP